MGDRGNIVMKDGNQEIFFYTQWRGEELLTVVRSALARRQRWDNSPYLSRMVFCELVKGRVDDAAGFGISTERDDFEHDDVVVDVRNRVVYTRKPQEGEDVRTSDALSFEVFITANNAETAFPDY
ncbi:MAG: hypothetical protein LZF86_140007 [Nitrospira sp.]|nr:MAG: hypothetical protein LZF86_140007 [Nitrospira sp.]